MNFKWENWLAADVSPAERTKWAERIAAGETSSVQSGDSMVFSEVANPDELLITDVRVRREARVPVPAGYWDEKKIRAALADALIEVLEIIGMPSVHIECSNPLTATRLTAARQEARAALKQAGRLP